MTPSLPHWLTRWFGTRGVSARGPHGGHDEAAHDSARGVTTTPVPMPDCESVMRQLWDYLDGELTPERMAAIRAHLDMCQRCYPQYEFERSFLDAIAGSPREHSNPERLRARLMAALQAKGLGDV